MCTVRCKSQLRCTSSCCTRRCRNKRKTLNSIIQGQPFDLLDPSVMQSDVSFQWCFLPRQISPLNQAQWEINVSDSQLQTSFHHNFCSSSGVKKRDDILWIEFPFKITLPVSDNTRCINILQSINTNVMQQNFCLHQFILFIQYTSYSHNTFNRNWQEMICNKTNYFIHNNASLYRLLPFPPYILICRVIQQAKQ